MDWGLYGSGRQGDWLRERGLGDQRGVNAGDSMEATGGFEPPNRGFADLRLNHLATSPRFGVRPSNLRWRPGFPNVGAEGGI